MSLSDLISLKGLVTVSLGAIVSIKAIHFTWKINKNNVNINGDNNSVSIVEQRLSEAERSFTLLWSFLAVLLTFTYPIWGETYNSILATAAYFGIPISVVALVAAISGSGLKRIWDVFYVAGTAFACWLVACSVPYLPSTAQYAAVLVALVRVAGQLGVNGLFFSPDANTYSTALIHSASGLIGFVLLFLSFGFLVFSFLRPRSFDGALRRVASYSVMCAVGYLMVGGLLYDHDAAHLATLVSTAVPFSLN